MEQKKTCLEQKKKEKTLIDDLISEVLLISSHPVSIYELSIHPPTYIYPYDIRTNIHTQNIDIYLLYSILFGDDENRLSHAAALTTKPQTNNAARGLKNQNQTRKKRKKKQLGA